MPDTVILETEWVLRFACQFKPDQVCSALRKLLGLPNVYLTNPMLVHQALLCHENGLDFADAFHLAQSQDCERFYTFDEKLIKKAQGITNCEVEKPDA